MSCRPASHANVATDSRSAALTANIRRSTTRNTTETPYQLAMSLETSGKNLLYTRASIDPRNAVPQLWAHVRSQKTPARLGQCRRARLARDVPFHSVALCKVTSDFISQKGTTVTYLKNVYDKIISSTFAQVGSSRKSLSMKNKRGMSTSSPASSFCSSKQKHSTLAKYGAIYNKIVIMSERKAHVQAQLTRSGVTLYVAIPMTSLSDLLCAL